jgi:hypothetical protein
LYVCIIEMSSFKPKTNKAIKCHENIAVTLDSKHSELMDEFMKDEQKTIPELELELKELIDKLNNGNSESQTEVFDRVSEIKNKIKSCKQRKKEYLLDNSKYIFDYFEEKKSIATNNSTITKNQMLKSFFKMDEPIVNENKKKKSNVVEKYLGNVDDAFLDVNAFVSQTDICSNCGKGELMELEDEGVLICSNCAKRTPYLIDNEKPSYKDAPKEVCFYAYKRINHFKEILTQFQGKETTQIPADVIENIKTQIKKERIELKTITNAKTKDILKRLGYNKYYEHIPFIKDKLGIRPPIMPQELEEKLCSLFADLQAPYSRFCPDDRVNFLNYYYTAYKLCELLDEREFLQHFSMLKDREKIIEQDAIWRNICEELNWEFIATI